MSKKKRIILLTITILLLIMLVYLIYWDQTRCYKIQRRCTIIDLSKIENTEEIDFYRWLNEKCMGKCWTALMKLKLEKRWCRYQYKQHINRSKNRKTFNIDTYNPCPELYTIKELNKFINK